MTKINLSMQQKQTHRHREQTQTQRLAVAAGGGGTSGRDGETGVWEEQMQTIIYRRERNKVLLQSTGNYIQYHVMKS